jgi:hypothetical protein
MDAADAGAIREAVRRPNMGFVPIKEADQQAAPIKQRRCRTARASFSSGGARCWRVRFALMPPSSA